MATKDSKIPISSKLPIKIRKIRSSDEKYLLNLNEGGLSDFEFKARLNRLRLLKNGIENCFVATNDQNEPCHMHWLFSYEQNEILYRYFGGGFPELKRDYYLFEGGFTPKKFRGFSIMPYAMHLIKKEVIMGDGYVLGFVDSDNYNSLKAMIKGNYTIFLKKKETWRYFQRHIFFESVGISEGECLAKKIESYQRPNLPPKRCSNIASICF